MGMTTEEDNSKAALSITCGGCTQNCLATHSSLALNSGGASFYMVMPGDISSALEIPAELAARMKYRDCKDAVLKGPNGHLWHVNFCCNDTSASFRDGWQSFVSDNGIAEKYTLVFRHAIDTYFVVQVFGATQCEQGTSLQNHTSCCLKEGILSGICNQKSCKHKKVPTKVSAAFNTQKNKDIYFQNLTTVKEEIDVDYSMTAAVSSEKRRKALHNTDNAVSQRQDVLFKKHPRNLGAVPKVTSCSVTKDDSEVVIAVPNSVKSMEPLFSAILTKCTVSTNFWLTIPKEFGDRWLPNEKVEVIFVHHKNPGVWRLMYRIFKTRGSRGVCWKAFVLDNKLHEGDNCVFKLINRRSHIFMVYVIRWFFFFD